jgi:MFS family permease
MRCVIPKPSALTSGARNLAWIEHGTLVISLAADLTSGRGRFNTLAGIFATALAIGGVAGPVISRFIVERAGFRSTFFLFAALAVAGAVILTVPVPETRPAAQRETRSTGSGAKEFAA